MIFPIPKITQVISKWMILFWTGHRSTNNARSPPPTILNLKNGDEKVKEEKKKRDKEEHRGDRREVVGKGSRILKISVY